MSAILLQGVVRGAIVDVALGSSAVQVDCDGGTRIPRICLIGNSSKHESPAREARALTRNADFKRRELV